MNRIQDLSEVEKLSPLTQLIEPSKLPSVETSHAPSLTSVQDAIFDSHRRNSCKRRGTTKSFSLLYSARGNIFYLYSVFFYKLCNAIYSIEIYYVLVTAINNLNITKTKYHNSTLNYRAPVTHY